MELFIQMGHGTQSLALEHLDEFGDGTIILSPMNILPKNMKNYVAKIHKKNGKVIIDPQLYYPRQTQTKLEQYDYWPKRNITFLESGQFDNVVKKLAELNKECCADAFLLPSIMAKKIDDLWNRIQKIVIEKSKQYSTNIDYIHTIALSSDVVNDETQIEKIISYVDEWDIEGVYIVCEHPERYYLVDRPLWVSNIMSLVAGIKRQKKKVIVGYANHQLLCMSLAKCDAIASGNFLNVRWLQPEHFETMDEKQHSRRSVWYYCPQALSEFKIPFLDIAKRMELLSKIAPPVTMENVHCEMLFSGSLPSSTAFSEKEAFRHYLYCLRKQCQSSVRDTYQETRNFHLAMLGTAEQLLSGLREKGIRGQDRDFMEIIDVNRAAIAAFDMAYQYPLTQEWKNL